MREYESTLLTYAQCMYACSSHQLREQFIAGLNNRIRAKMEGSGFRAYSTSYSHLLGAALDAEASVRIEDRGISRSSTVTAAGRSNSPAGVNREVGRTQTPSNRTPRSDGARYNPTRKPVAIQAAGRADRAVCYTCNEPGHYASHCPHKEARVKQLEIELAALRAGEDFLSTNEEDVLLSNGEGPIEEPIGTTISLRPIDIAPHLFEEEGSSDDGDPHSLRLQSLRTETFPPSNFEGGYMKGFTALSLSLRGMERPKPPRVEEETSW